MIVLRVSKNDEVVCQAGAEDLAVVSAIIGGVGKLGKFTTDTRDEPPMLSVRVGGLTDRENGDDEPLRWCEGEFLSPGDKVTVEVLESDYADPPSQTTPKDTQREEEILRERWEEAREIYQAYREKFEE